MRSPTLKFWIVSGEAWNSCTVPSVYRTVSLFCAASAHNKVVHENEPFIA